MEVPPSQNIDKYWIGAYNQSTEIHHRSSHGGKWLIFQSLEDLDENWNIVKQGTESGLLGYYSCVSTLKNDTHPKDGHVHPNKVICVFTYCEHDKEDIFRVRRGLLSLGFQDTLCYKTYKATKAGEFSHLGYRNISKYVG